jgi:hypothetical protein
VPRQIGAIAQLGERLICIQEVVGSIPSGSTIISLARMTCVTAARTRRASAAGLFGRLIILLAAGFPSEKNSCSRIRAVCLFCIHRKEKVCSGLRHQVLPVGEDAVFRLSLSEAICLCSLTAHNRTDLVKIWSFPVSERRASNRNKIAFGYLAMAIGNENDQVS